MSNEPWLRDALRAAAASQPVVGDRRAIGALRLAAVRRKQRLAMASFSAVLAVFVASSLTGGSGTRGLEPVSPTATPSASESPFAEESPAASPMPGSAEDPDGVEMPEEENPGTPIPAEDRLWRYALDPRPVDVYFLVDRTSGMGDYDHFAAMTGVVRGLRARGADVQYGYGFVRDYSGTGHLFTAGEAMYERVQRIQPDPAAVVSAAHMGGDAPGGQTFGLMGSTGWTDGTWIRESQPAGFRAGSRRFVVLITDKPMHSGPMRTGPTEQTVVDYPTIEEAIAALNDQSIVAASLQVIDVQHEAAREDLDRLARGTHAIASHTIDCDGDGRYYEEIDPRKGDPLVCTTWPDAEDGWDWTGFADGLLTIGTKGPR